MFKNHHKYGRITLVFTSVLLSFSLVSSVWAEATLIYEPQADDSLKAHIYQLENGLMVYLTVNRETPRFYAEIAVRTGSKHDPAETTGLAHYLEHLLFKGSKRLGTVDYAKEKPHLEKIEQLYEQHFNETDPEKRKAIYAQINTEAQLAAQYAVPNEYDSTYNALGATGMNAHTWHEETIYKVSLPANELERWAVLESDRFADPVFRLFHTELETVYEEYNRAADNPERIIRYAVNELLYPVHPYGQQTTLGKGEHLKSPSIRNINNYYEARYVPNNMAIIVSGDIDVDKAIKVIDEHFSVWERRPIASEPTWNEQPLETVRRRTVTYEGEEKVQLAFRTVSRNDPDEAAALEMLDMILDNSKAGLVNINLNQAQRVRNAGSYPTMYNDYGAQNLWGIPKQGQSLEEVEQLLLEQIDLIKKGKFEDWIIPAIINDYKKRHKSDLENNKQRVSTIRNSFIAHQDWTYAQQHLDRIAAVTKDDVVAVANKYFGENYVAVYRVDQPHEVVTIPKPAIDKINIDSSRHSKFASEVLSTPTASLAPQFVTPGEDYSVTDIRQGVKLYYAPNELNDLFTLTFTVNFGKRHDTRLGMAGLLLDKSGTKELTSAEVKQRWYQLATEFGFSPEQQQTTISISGLDENLEASLDLLMQLMRQPTVDEQAVEQLKEIILVQRADAMKNPQSVSGALYNFNRNGEQSRYMNIMSNQEVKAADPVQLHNLLKSLLKYEHTISYTGSLSRDSVVKKLSKYYRTREMLQPAPAYITVATRRPEQTEIYFVNKSLAQAMVRIEMAGEVYNEDNRPAASYYNEYFAGGMAGIVFQELREARALAYVAGARYFTAYRKDDENLMIGVIHCQPDKTIEAVGTFIDIIDNLQHSPKRFEAAKQSLVNQYRSSKLTTRQILPAVLMWEDQGVEIDPRRARFESIATAEIDLMMSFHQAQIANQPKLISIVGDETKIDMEKLAEFGPIRKVKVDEIFGFEVKEAVVEE